MATTYPRELDSGPTHYVGAFFPSADHFVVSGGEFISVTNYITDTSHTDSGFRCIRLGDVDLRHEIRLDNESPVANRIPTSGCVRKVYSARIDGCALDMTVATYQGFTAEEEWRRDLVQYHGLRHPHVVQIYGIVNSGGLHATVFHGDLIPIQHFFRLYRDSAISTAYLHGYFSAAFIEAATYIQSVSHARITHASYTPWIRVSTGGLCIELTPCHTEQELYPYTVSENVCRTPITLLGPDQDSTIIAALTLHQYHEICHWSLSRICDYALQYGVPIRLGGIMTGLGSLRAQPLEIAYLPDCGITDSGWKLRSRRTHMLEEPVVLENGWTRFYYSGDDTQRSWKMSRTVSVGEGMKCPTCCWLGQASNVLSRASITFSDDEIVCISSVDYELDIVDVPTESYIFLCPLEYLGAEKSSQFWRPTSPAYWSLDPLGRDALALHEAKHQIGVPFAVFKSEIWGWSWNETVYTGLRKFHEGKGFDPDSQDVALQLGLPLYQLSPICYGPFEHQKVCFSGRDDDYQPLIGVHSHVSRQPACFCPSQTLATSSFPR
ncbi:hypothetical protein B0H19DRAFT_1160620 [Mycena capillaripes]|nr:hypothetical protein B0H19DRAFT_1160620 [Mycena capillaripes]